MSWITFVQKKKITNYISSYGKIEGAKTIFMEKKKDSTIINDEGEEKSSIIRLDVPTDKCEKVRLN